MVSCNAYSPGRLLQFLFVKEGSFYVSPYRATKLGFLVAFYLELLERLESRGITVGSCQVDDPGIVSHHPYGQGLILLTDILSVLQVLGTLKQRASTAAKVCFKGRASLKEVTGQMLQPKPQK